MTVGATDTKNRFPVPLGPDALALCDNPEHKFSAEISLLRDFDAKVKFLSAAEENGNASDAGTTWLEIDGPTMGYAWHIRRFALWVGPFPAVNDITSAMIFTCRPGDFAAGNPQGNLDLLETFNDTQGLPFTGHYSDGELTVMPGFNIGIYVLSGTDPETIMVSGQAIEVPMARLRDLL